MKKKTREKGKQKPPPQKKAQWFRNSNQELGIALVDICICHSAIIITIQFLKQ
jgi:hypothetical protein